MTKRAVHDENYADIVDLLVLDDSIVRNTRFNIGVMQEAAFMWLKRQKWNIECNTYHVLMPRVVNFIFDLLEGNIGGDEHQYDNVDMLSSHSSSSLTLTRQESMSKFNYSYALSLNISLLRKLLENLSAIGASHPLLQGREHKLPQLKKKGEDMLTLAIEKKVINLKVNLMAGEVDEEVKVDEEEMHDYFRSRCTQIVDVLQLVNLLKERMNRDS